MPRTTAHNREPGNKLIHIWVINVWQRNRDYTVGKGEFLQEMVFGKLDSHMQNNETGPLSYIIKKN